MLLNEAFDIKRLSNNILEEMYQEFLNQDYDKLANTTVENSYEITSLKLPVSVQEAILIDYNEDYPNNPVKDFKDVLASYVFRHPYAKKYVFKTIRRECIETFKEINSLGNPLKLYRFINFDYNRWKPRDRKSTQLSIDDFYNHIMRTPNIHLGVCWTPSFDSAVDFGDLERKIDKYSMILEITANRNAINFLKTFTKRSQFSYWSYENEIELIKGSIVRLDKIHIPYGSEWYPVDKGGVLYKA